MDNSLKGLILAAGVIITCIIMGLGFYISREAKNTSNNGAGQISNMNAEFQDVNLALFDGLKVSGSEVTDLISSMDFSTNPNLKINIITGENSTGKVYDKVAVGSSSFSFPQKGDSDYINPSAQFLGKVETDKNNIIKSITFNQQ